MAACYLGWTLDAFDFFILIFVLRKVAPTFDTDITPITRTITLTLLLRALGAFVFGQLADRFGRRPSLIANVLIYSGVQALGRSTSPRIPARPATGCGAPRRLTIS